MCFVVLEYAGILNMTYVMFAGKGNSPAEGVTLSGGLLD